VRPASAGEAREPRAPVPLAARYRPRSPGAARAVHRHDRPVRSRDRHRFHRAERVARRAVCQLPIAFVSEYALGAQPEVHEAGAAVAPARNKVGRPGAEPLGEDIPETADFDPPLALKISMPNVLGTIVEHYFGEMGRDSGLAARRQSSGVGRISHSRRGDRNPPLSSWVLLVFDVS
jgi:hypothetical protein